MGDQQPLQKSQQSVKVKGESIEGGLLKIKESVHQWIVKQESGKNVNLEHSFIKTLEIRHFPTFVALDTNVGDDQTKAKKRRLLGEYK